MSFDSAKFYAELDRLYAAHDNNAVERFLQDELSKAEQTVLVSSSCGCCACGDDEPDEATLQWYSDRSQARICILNEMGAFYRGINRWNECLDAFNGSIEELSNLGLGSTDNYAISLFNVAGTYRLMGDYEKALANYREAESILLKNGTADPYTLSSLYNNIGLLYQDQGQLETAMEYCLKGLEITRTGQDNQAEVATGLANLAGLSYAMGDLGRAEEYITESLGIFADLDGGTNAHYAGALNTKAILCYRQGRLEEAVSFFEKSIELTRLIFGENGDYVTTCRNCAAVLIKTGQSDKAKKYSDMADRAEKRG